MLLTRVSSQRWPGWRPGLLWMQTFGRRLTRIVTVGGKNGVLQRLSSYPPQGHCHSWSLWAFCSPGKATRSGQGSDLGGAAGHHWLQVLLPKVSPRAATPAPLPPCLGFSRGNEPLADQVSQPHIVAVLAKCIGTRLVIETSSPCSSQTRPWCVF